MAKAPLSRREREILDILYRLGRASAHDVLAAMPDPPSYSAVRAHLRLLEERGHAKHVEEGGRYVYAPQVPRGEARKKALSHLVSTFFGGSVGNIYRQFAAVMVSSIGFSAFMALSLTPALCATLLKPVQAGHHHAKTGFFGWFNRGFSRTAKNYESLVARLLRRAARYLVIYAAIIVAVAVVYIRMPISFLPGEDQGTILVNTQLPPGATQERTRSVMQQVEGFILKQPEVQSMVSVLGFSFSGQGQNAALGFVTLKDWSERKGDEHSAQTLAGRAFGALMGVRDAFIFPLSPPPIPELGNAAGFTFRLQDRGGMGHDALVAARNQQPSFYSSFMRHMPDKLNFVSEASLLAQRLQPFKVSWMPTHQHKTHTGWHVCHRLNEFFTTALAECGSGFIVHVKDDCIHITNGYSYR